MEWVIFLAFVVQSNCISSQPLTNENVRESRQLKLDECCPCPTADRIKDNHVLDTNIAPSDCPCRAADSDTASSIFTPTLKAVQSFVRPHKDEPKPLLNPEVGLASSVLETLREATDQEYEEALARDVARSALQAMDPDADEIPLSASTNVFNNILSPRNSEAIDVIPEASHNDDEMWCIHPTLNRKSELGQFKTQPQRNVLKDFLLSKPLGLAKNTFDMENSPSNIQENILPSKNKLLDDIKIKTNLLKSKLFTTNKGLLQRMVTDKSGQNHKNTPGWKLVVPLDSLKSSKLFDSNRQQPVAEKTKDLFLLNNNISKNNAQVNRKLLIPLQKPQQSNKYVTDEVLSSEANYSPVSKEVQRFKNTKDYEIDSNADTSILNPVLSKHDDCNLKKENKLQVETTTKKNHFLNVIDSNTSNMPVLIPSHYSTEILDTLPSPSESTTDENNLIDITDYSPQEDSNIESLPEINIEPQPEHITQSTSENSKPTSIAKPTDVQDNTNNWSTEKNSEEADKYIPEIVCTTKNTVSGISSFYSVSTPDSIAIKNVFNHPINKNEEGNIDSINAESSNRKEETPESINNIQDKNKENNINIFPNIREGLIKTFENVKKINDEIKLNVQDALQLVNVKNNVVMRKEPTQNPVFMPEILTIPHKSKSQTSNTPSSTLTSEELQKMSDSILSSSSVNKNSDPSLRSSLNELSDTIQKMDSDGEPSEIISCLTPAEVYTSRKTEEKPLKNNNKQMIKSSSKNQQQFENLNTDMAYRYIGDKPIKSEKHLEKSSLNIKEPSTVIFDENEMAAQASESKPQRNFKIGPDNSRHIKQNFEIKPSNELDEFGRSLLNVNNFFDNVKSTISGVFSKTNENILRETEDNEDKIDNNYKINKQDHSLHLDKQKMNLKKKEKFLKAPEAIQTNTYAIGKYKPNLNLYKARVAVPKTFEVNPIQTLDETLDKRSRTLNNRRNILPKTYSSKTFVYHSNENVSNENLRSLFRETEHNNPNSESTILSPNILENSFTSSASKNLGSLKDRTEEAFQNFHKTFGSSLRAVPSKENNRYLTKNIAEENLFETIASKRNEWNEKLHAINLDLNDRLSLLSHRMADSILPSLNYQPLPRRMNAKSRSDVKTKPGSNNLRRINASSNIKSELPKSKLRQSNDKLSVPKKSLISGHLSDLKSPRLYKNSLVKPATLKPPQTIKKVSNLTPKITAPSLEKKSFVSRLQSGEPHPLGSENIMSKVLLDKRTDTDKSALDVSSDESDQKKNSNFKDFKASKQEEARNVALSKLKEAFKAKMLNRDSNKKDSKNNNLKSSANTDLEIIPSASEKVNKEIDGSLKQNVQYKCKMLCTKDK